MAIIVYDDLGVPYSTDQEGYVDTGDGAGLAYLVDDYGNPNPNGTIQVRTRTLNTSATPVPVDDSLAYISGGLNHTTTGVPLTRRGISARTAPTPERSGTVGEFIASVPTWGWIAGGGLLLVLMLGGGGSRKY